MNIALAYSGQPRNIIECWQNHQKYILNPNKRDKNQIYIFAHFWFDESDIGKDFVHGSNSIGKFTVDSKNYFDYVVNPNLVKYEKQINFDSSMYTPDPRFPHPFERTLSMFYSMHEVGKIINIFSKENDIEFDIVAKMRSDQVFQKKIDFSKHLNSKTINIHEGIKFTNYSINDNFAFGNQELMSQYFKTFMNIDELINQGAAVNPECLLGWNVKNFYGIDIVEHNYKLQLFRASYLKYSKVPILGNIALNLLELKKGVKKYLKKFLRKENYN